MATAPVPTPASPPPPQEIRIYSHSSLFYWWPVWACGFIMTLVTAVSGLRMGIVPGHTVPMLGQEIASLKDPKDTRDILVTPKGTKLPQDNAGQPIEPHLRISNSKNVGVLFCTILLLVIFITNVPLRGLWSVIVIGVIIFLSIIFALLGWWEVIFTYLGFLDIRINMGGYLFISIVLLILWILVTILFDKQIYMVFTPGQFKVHLEIGGGETAYDTMGMTIEKRRSDLFRHLILGFGSGDLVVRTSGAQAHTFEIPNVLSLGRRVREIEDMQRSKQVMTGQS